MNTFTKLILGVSMIGLLAGCTSTRWVVEDEEVINESEAELQSKEYLFELVEQPSTDAPVVSLDLYELRDNVYPLHLTSRKYVQQYRPRYWFLGLGIATSAVLVTVAHTDLIHGEETNDNQRVMLNSTAAVLTGASVMSMKPDGEKQPTGSEQLLSQTGTVQRRDTVLTDRDDTLTVQVYDDEMLYMEEIEAELSNGAININLVEALNIDEIRAENPADINIRFEYEGDSYSYNFPVSDFMERFVEATSGNVPVRSGTDEQEDDILTNVSAGERLPLEDTQDDDWYIVRRGGITGYILKEDSRIIWKSGAMARGEELVDGSENFGVLEIERDIPQPDPDLQTEDINVIIWANSDYQDPEIEQIENIERSIELVENYAETRLGVPDNQILVHRDLTYDQAQQAFSEDNLNQDDEITPTDSTHFIIYYLGHGLAESDAENQAYLLPSDFDSEEPTENRVGVKDWLSALDAVESASTTVVLDTDFVGSSVTETLSRADRYASQIRLRDLAGNFTNSDRQNAVIFAARSDQKAGQYRSDDGRTNNFYGIFTYYFFHAMREDNIRLNDLFRSVERNVTFTSRRLHDRSQDPSLFGDPEIDWLRERPQ